MDPTDKYNQFQNSLLQSVSLKPKKLKKKASKPTNFIEVNKLRCTLKKTERKLATPLLDSQASQKKPLSRNEKTLVDRLYTQGTLKLKQKEHRHT